MSTATISNDIDSLLHQNENLREEIELLQQENSILRRRLKRAEGQPKASAERPPNDRPGAALRDLGSTGTDWRAPSLEEGTEAAPQAKIFRSKHMGRGLEPDEIDAPLEPKEQRRPPALDVGYVNRVGEDELHGLPYGMMVLDNEGRVLFYNETEAQLAGYDREKVTGQNFFEDVAPCTRVKQFQGAFQDFVSGKLGRVHFFDFAFHFAHGTQEVTIALSQGRRKGQVNVMMMRNE